jgi:alpha-maltose-1-phosphate synthase
MSNEHELGAELVAPSSRDFAGAPERKKRPVRVAMALYGDLTHDSRVRKEARSLADSGYDVTIVCLASQGTRADLPPNVGVLTRRPAGPHVTPGSSNPFFVRRLSRIGAMRSRAAWLATYIRGLRAWGALAVEAAGAVDVWHAHDLTGLAAISPHVRRHIPIVYDSHELFLESGTSEALPGIIRALLRAYERRLVSRAAATITVSQELAAILRHRYRPRELRVVHNCPPRWTQPEHRPTYVHDAAGVGPDASVILYHGVVGPDRGIEQLLEAMLEPGLEDAHMVFMGDGPLRERCLEAATAPRWGGRVHVLDPVPPSDLLPWVASAEIGAMPYQSSSLNNRLSTPNKLFECLAAGIPVIASDFPTLRRIIVDNPGGPLGAVCDPSDVQAIAASIRSLMRLTPDEMAVLRDRCRVAAEERWNWGREAQTLVAVYTQILSRPQGELPSGGSAAPDHLGA